MNPNAVVIVSAFGRGDLLAIQLQKNGFDVTLMDCTEAMDAGQFAGAGPFPLVTGVPSFAHLENGLKEVDLSRGLVVWTPDGPLEFAGPMSAFLQEQYPALRYAMGGVAPKKRDFPLEWLKLFLYQLTSPWLIESTKAHQTGEMFLPKAPLVLLNHSTFQKGLLKATQDVGVKRVMTSQLENLATDGKRIFELNGVSAPSYVWMLSSFETFKLNTQVADSIFGAATVIEPDWQWVRFDLRSSMGPWWTGVPHWSVVVEDIYLPWTYANSFVLRKGGGGNWETWLKVPHHRLKDRNARNEWARQIEKVLLKRLPHGQWLCDETSLKTDPQGLIFDAEKLKTFSPLMSNMFWIAHETLPGLDLSSWWLQAEKLVPRIEDARTREIRKGKGARSDQALHAP